MNKNLKKSELLTLGTILIISLVLFLLILFNFNGSFLSNLDNIVHANITKIQTPFIVSLSKIISNAFEPAIFGVILLIVIIYLYLKKRKSEAVYLTIIIAIAFALAQGLKVLIARARPTDILVSESTFSFPSSHALIGVIFFGTLIYLFEHHIRSVSIKRILTAFAAFLSIIMGLSRIILNAHWFSDVIAGFSLGIFLLTIYILFNQESNFVKFRKEYDF